MANIFLLRHQALLIAIVFPQNDVLASLLIHCIDVLVVASFLLQGELADGLELVPLLFFFLLLYLGNSDLLFQLSLVSVSGIQ